MYLDRLTWQPGVGWVGLPATRHGAAVAILYFGPRDWLSDGDRHRELCAAFPDAIVLGCSTGGQIAGAQVRDDIIAAVAITFEHTRLRYATEDLTGAATSHDCGERLGRRLAAPDLAGILLLSDGLDVNGSALADGMGTGIGRAVPILGGLAADGARFQETLVAAGEHAPRTGRAVALGFYGDALRIGSGSCGGWDRFGPPRRITAAQGNVLRELDGASALALYERYLGDEASGLPGSALLFPLRIWDPADPGSRVVRTVLSVDREAGTMTFAGDMPQGWRAELLHGSFERLVDGAEEAAAEAVGAHSDAPLLALLVSCIGRRLLMGQRVQDEVDAAVRTLPQGSVPIGFYSYGEFAPQRAAGRPRLHNQTMTVATLAEVRPC